LLCAALAASTFATAAPAQTTSLTTKPPAVPTRAVKVLPPELSRSLAITRMPTTQPVPIVIGTYWNCQDGGNGLCRLVLVVCTDDQSLCAEV
jgi:hypothetical protein